MEGVKRKGTMQGDARPMSLLRHHGRGGRDCKKWKAFYTQTRIPSPIFITGPIFIIDQILSSALTNTSALHYGLIVIQPGSRVIATSSMVTATSSMVTEPKSVVLFRL